MRVAVLGCGPAGLMAAHAVAESGHEVIIYSRKQKSPLYGAQYLHKPIPGVTDRDNHVTVEYMVQGAISDYRRKVYGNVWDGTVSPEDLEETHEAWDIRETYDRLWEKYQPVIIPVKVDPAGINVLLNSTDISLVINTIPLNMLCTEGHAFQHVDVVAAGDAPDLGIDIGRQYHCPMDTVILNGEPVPLWYRISNIFDHTTVEWPSGSKVPVSTASKVIKPTKTNCDCWPDMLRVGRYGSWTKGVLSHSAYFETMRSIEDATGTSARYNDPSMPTLF